MTPTLKINGLELFVHLGWPENERLKQQVVTLDIDIEFSQSPKACETDQLEDTICYHDLITKIQEMTAERHFFLIEHLSAEIYQFIQPLLPKNSRVIVHVTKRPNIKNLLGHVQFSYSGDAT
ncbi:MAG: dihydroneopterin aldolase [uncultured bacterium]|nr:MAG: dihydroneopterin aldolase [uncultured bacterium]